MDVHPPHEPIRSWRDFLLHLATITIGLLIAVALEAGVEELHYRHIVSAARANLRREISENHAIYAQNLQSLEANQERLAHNIEQLRDIRAGKPPQHIDMHWRFDWNSFGDSAWQSARDIGAIRICAPTRSKPIRTSTISSATSMIWARAFWPTRPRRQRRG